ASRGGTGIEIDLEKVPQRGPGMTPYEILLSESQERMLIIVHQGREEEVKRIFDKWDLPWACVGQVTDTGNMVVRHHGEIVVDVSARLLTDEGPVYHREDRQPSYMESTQAFRLDGISDTNDPTDHLKSLLAWPTIASKNWVYRQYDHMVRNGTVVCPGSDAAVIRIKADSIPAMKGLAGDSASFPEKLLAMSVDCNAVYVYLDPYEGGKAAVAEAARNLACSGATPLGVTDNLNFGNPHKPEIFYQLKEAVRGVAEACRVFKAPVTGGNVSLYNQNPDGAIDPTPTIAMVGQIENSDWVTTQWFKNTGDAIYLLGNPVDENDPLSGLGGSAYLQCLHGLKTGTPPPCDLEREKKLNEALLHLIGKGWIQSAHDCSDGGLAVALAESCFSRETTIDQPELHGANIDLSTAGEERLDALLFGESQARIIISCNPSDEASIVECMEQKSVPYCRLGSVGGDSLIIQTETLKVNCSIADLHDIWWNSIALKMSGD
ncbi:MAG TPA: phosphoribosylformylglycinamidine synthase II, partial [Verrucomicrobiales bacterium]|nr:phosphoribosylformylglycinamidine synthase II [Verrucomicrobiales bacterium]